MAGVLSCLALVATRADATPSRSGSGSSASQTVTVDGTSPGRTYDGVGVESASSSRLLIDYPRRERNQILDYLFKPGYGASLSMLEVEIGSDVNSTTIAEPSHERTAGVIDCNRGYEWWLMQQAKQRNPDIKLWALAFGFPSWVGKLWSPQQVQYTADWLRCAKQHGLTIDYIGGSNQRQVSAGTIPAGFLTSLKAAARDVYPDIQLVAPDQGGVPPYWKFAREMLDDPSVAAAVDVLGETTICGWRTLYQTCEGPGDPSWTDAMATDKPLWDSSASTADATAGAGLIARSLNRSYIQARVTGHNYWSALSAVYGDGWDTGIGTIDAQWPWSGHYVLGTSIWAMAQTTQFTKPGWRYLDAGSGFLEDGASYVSLRSPATDDYSIVIESMDATQPETVSFRPTGGLSDGRVELWSTDIASPSAKTDLRHVRTFKLRNGVVTMTVQPGFVYTLTSIHGHHRGTGAPRAGADQRQPLPYEQRFDAVPAGEAAPGFNDANGGFEAAPCQGGRTGTCYRQVVDSKPIIWQRGGNMDPTTFVGDPMWWGDYAVSADAMLEGPGTVSLLGRIERWNKDSLVGYLLSVSDTGAWQLYYQHHGDSWTENWNGPAGAATNTVLASGQTEFGVGQWHRLGLSFRGSTIVASIDGHTLGTAHDSHSTTGQVGFRVNGWQTAEWDDLTVVPTAPQPATLRRSRMTATATSSQAGPLQYQTFEPALALDGRPETEWMSSYCDDIEHSDSTTLCAAPDVKPLPQSITIDLGHRTHGVSGLLYKPPVGNTRTEHDGIITGYEIAVSSDGRRFEQVASGTWATDIGSKRVTWTPRGSVRYVRLEASAADGGVAGASELQVLAAHTRARG